MGDSLLRPLPSRRFEDVHYQADDSKISATVVDEGYESLLSRITQAAAEVGIGGTHGFVHYDADDLKASRIVANPATRNREFLPVRLRGTENLFNSGYKKETRGGSQRLVALGSAA